MRYILPRLPIGQILGHNAK